jgi:hypothetical protein
MSVVVVALIAGAGAADAQDFPKPGPEQERLKVMAGTWDGNVKCTFEPGKPAQESKGVLVAKLDLGGFFLTSEFKGDLGGMPFQGRGVTGYDPFKKKYTGVWVDSMSPSLFMIEGSFDKTGKVYTELMEGPDPKGNVMKMRAVTEMKDADSMRFTMFNRGEDGKEAQMMEITYTRRK